MSRGRRLAAAAGTTVLCAAVLLLGGSLPVWLRTAVAVPFVLLLPGAAALSMWDPRARLGRLERFALSVAGSIAFTILAGMGLAAATILTRERVIVALAGATLLMLVVAWPRSEPEAEPAGEARGVTASLGAAALGLSALALLVLVLSVPRAYSGPGTVQLWASPDASGGVRISARNIDATSKSFRLTVEQGGGRITRQEVTMPQGAERVFEVRASATWTKSAPLTAILTDVSGELAPRSISVWPKQ